MRTPAIYLGFEIVALNFMLPLLLPCRCGTNLQREEKERGQIISVGQCNIVAMMCAAGVMHLNNFLISSACHACVCVLLHVLQMIAQGFFSALFRRGVRTQTEAPADEEDGDNQIESTDSVANLNGLRSKSFLASAMARPSLTFAPSTNLSTGGSSDFLSTRFNNSSLDSAMLPPITISSTGVMRSARSSTVGASPPMCSPNHGSSLGFRSHVGAQLRGIDGGSAEGGSSEADDSAGGSPMHQQTFMLASTPFARMSMGDSILVKRSMGSMTSASRLSKQMSEGLTLGDGDAPFSCDDSVASFSVARTQSRTAMASRRAGGSGNIIAAALASPSGSGALNRGNPHPLNPNSNPGLQVSLNSPSTSASSGMAASGSQQSLAPTPPAVERPVIFGRRRAAPVRQETAPSLGAPERETGSGDGAWIPTAPMAPVPPTPLHRRSLVSTASSTPSATASNGPIPPSLPIAASGNTISGASTPNVFGSPPLNMSAKSMNGGTVGLGSQSYNGCATPSHYPGPGSIMGSMGQDTFDDFDDGCSVLGLVGGPQRADERIKALWAVQDATEKGGCIVCARAQLAC